MHVNIEPSKIRDAYRLPGKPGRNKATVVDFVSVLTKQRWLSAVRTYNMNKDKEQKLNTHHAGIHGQPSPIYVSEYLTGSDRKLYYQAREFAKIYDYKFCWIANRKIFWRKDETSNDRIKISSEQDLHSLKPTD